MLKKNVWAHVRTFYTEIQYSGGNIRQYFKFIKITEFIWQLNPTLTKALITLEIGVQGFDYMFKLFSKSISQRLRFALNW